MKDRTVKIIIGIIVFIYFICISLIAVHESCYKTKLASGEIPEPLPKINLDYGK